MALDYAGRCQRYARQRGWAYDPEQMSIGHLTPRQKRRALKKERHAWDGRYRHAIDMPRDLRHHYGMDDYDDYDDYRPDIDPLGMYDYPDPHDLGYCVTPGCNCCGGDD